MEITWLGRTCFRIRGREGTVITDPCPPESGYRIGRLTADIVTLSRHDEPGYSATSLVTTTGKILDAPGEYEIGGILVTGIATRPLGEGRNIVFMVELEGIRVAHLGLLAGPPPATVLDALKNVDVVLIPVGGGNALGGPAAQDVMTTIDPKVVIPMNYRTEFEQDTGLEPLDRFVKETGTRVEPQPKLTVSRSSLPQDLTVVVLAPRP